MEEHNNEERGIKALCTVYRLYLKRADFNIRGRRTKLIIETATGLKKIIWQTKIPFGLRCDLQSSNAVPNNPMKSKKAKEEVGKKNNPREQKRSSESLSCTFHALDPNAIFFLHGQVRIRIFMRSKSDQYHNRQIELISLAFS